MPVDFGSKENKASDGQGNWGSCAFISPELIEGCHSTKLILVVDFSFR